MKICWDMLEEVCLTKSGTFRKGSITYIYKESCIKCSAPYLTEKASQSVFCSVSCVHTGRKLSDKSKEKIAIGNTGRIPSIETRKKMSKNGSERGGVSIFNWNGDLKGPGLTVYEAYKDILSIYEDIRKQENTEVLEARCAYCGKWFAPMREAVKHRLVAINNLSRGEQRLYCSENCKQSCPTFGQHKYPKGFKKGTSREVSTYLRQIVFGRDNWECQKCGKTKKEAPLHCHHIKGYAQNKILANDVDNCITLCKNCHKEIHKQKGCRYIDLRCK